MTENSTAEKLLKALSPLSCAETRRFFSELLRKNLDQAQEDSVQEHLTLCEECLLLLAAEVEKQVDSGAVPIQPFPDDIPFPPVEVFFRQQMREPLGQKTEAKETSPVRNFSLQALEAVASMTGHTNLHPEQMRKRMLNVGIILAVGVAGIIATLFSIGTGFSANEPARLLTVFLLVGSLALTFASSLAFALITWSAFVYQYVRAEKKGNATRALRDVVIDLGHEPTFDRAVLNLSIEELRNATTNATERSVLDQVAKVIATSDLRDTKIGEKLADLLRTSLARREDVSSLLRA